MKQRPKTERELHVELCLIDSHLHIARLEEAEKNTHLRKCAEREMRVALYRIRMGARHGR